MVHYEDVRKKSFFFNGDKYVGFDTVWKNCPRITGCPKLTDEKSRTYKSGTFTQHYTQNVAVKTRKAKHKRLGKYAGTKEQIIVKKRQRTRSLPNFRTMYAPNECKLTNLINWPFKRLGAYQAAITGAYGYGKSNLLHCLVALHLAQDVNILQFNDSRFEARSLCDKGYFDNSGEFHPYEINVFVPEGFQFDSENSDPLWNHRNNVNRVDWVHHKDIIKALAPHKLTVVYTECFDDASVLRLWIDLMKTFKRIAPKKACVFTHHEFSSLIPETPTRDIAKVVRDASNVAMNLRKDKIGIVTTFHMLSEVYYRFSQKFTFVIHRRPVMRKSMTKPEEDAMSFSRKKMNVVSGGRWRTHTIGMFPEIGDKYRLIPAELESILNYPTMRPAKDREVANAYSEIFNDPINIEIMQLRAQGLSYREIARELNLSVSTIHDRSKKLGVVQENK